MKQPRVSYSLDPGTSSFIIENYNWARPLSNFFPGIAGKWGIPMWVYYVNRGQAVCSAGLRDKDGQILEFYSFNKAVMRTAREGFRTFIRLDGGAVYEPFQKTSNPDIRQTMILSSAELAIRETNTALGLEISVTYFPLTNYPVAALIRDVRIRNLSRKARRIEWIDGAARILPYGLDQKHIKHLPRHIEGMMGTDNFHGVPIFRLKQTPQDVERVEKISGGNFYIACGLSLGKGLVTDPEAVFGAPMNVEHPWVFESGGARGVLKSPEYRENKTPAAFAVRSERLAPGGQARQVSILGRISRDSDLGGILSSLKKKDFTDKKRLENIREIDSIADHCFTASSSPEFDAYSRQNFLDNVIRGGEPVVFKTARGTSSAFYLNSRQNGDLERDYHQFVVDPTYLSQGTGHYRSVLQNRRCDTWFFPQVGDANILTFLNLIQLDGYNPLEVKGMTYRIENESGIRKWLAGNVRSAALRREILSRMKESFTPGEILMFLEKKNAVSGCSKKLYQEAELERIAREILLFCRENEIGGLHEGFWVDHWHYNFDLLDIYLAVYPDRLQELLLEKKDYTFFDDPDVILPRNEKSVNAGGKMRCYGAVTRNSEKERLIAQRKTDPYTVRTRFGKGSIYRTNLLAKLLCIVTNRLATIDPAGAGIEMEAGKPGWNDSMNGLPGLFGSGLSETIELRRAVRFLLDALERLNLPETKTVRMYEELAGFIDSLRQVIGRRNAWRMPNGREKASFRYWDEANTLKEDYRKKTMPGVSGREAPVSISQIHGFLLDAGALLDSIFNGPMRRKIMSRDGVPYTYFINEVVKHKATGRKNHLGYQLVRPLRFRSKPVRLFLEGPVHWMKDRPEEAKKIYAAVRSSKMYDRKLKMYKACQDMTGESRELGRAVGAYPRGWIENESIYLHMEYKYLLEILRSGLCSEFWRDTRSALVPFMNPAVYGRSTLEGASFLVSSAYGDPRLHGQAFQPRLSGMTAEFLHIWILAAAGPGAFRLDSEQRLQLLLRPRLPGWLFTTRAGTRRYYDMKQGWREEPIPENAFAFKLLGRVLIVYRNPGRKSTYGAEGVRPAAYSLEYRSGRVMECEGEAVAGAAAEAVRRGDVRRIDVSLR